VVALKKDVPTDVLIRPIIINEGLKTSAARLGQVSLAGTDVMIFKIFSTKNSAKKFGVFDSKQS
jgi:hypothetical protein